MKNKSHASIADKGSGKNGAIEKSREANACHLLTNPVAQKVNEESICQQTKLEELKKKLNVAKGDPETCKDQTDGLSICQHEKDLAEQRIKSHVASLESKLKESHETNRIQKEELDSIKVEWEKMEEKKRKHIVKIRELKRKLEREKKHRKADAKKHKKEQRSLIANNNRLQIQGELAVNQAKRNLMAQHKNLERFVAAQEALSFARHGLPHSDCSNKDSSPSPQKRRNRKRSRSNSSSSSTSSSSSSSS